jgi:hypothetical protein
MCREGAKLRVQQLLEGTGTASEQLPDPTDLDALRMLPVRPAVHPLIITLQYTRSSSHGSTHLLAAHVQATTSYARFVHRCQQQGHALQSLEPPDCPQAAGASLLIFVGSTNAALATPQKCHPQPARTQHWCYRQLGGTCFPHLTDVEEPRGWLWPGPPRHAKGEQMVCQSVSQSGHPSAHQLSANPPTSKQ